MQCKRPVPDTGEGGSKNIAYVCLITRKHLKTSLSANGLILVPWPKLNMVVIACPCHPTLSLHWVSASKSILPYSGKPFGFFSVDPVCEGKKKEEIPLHVSFTGVNASKGVTHRSSLK